MPFFRQMLFFMLHPFQEFGQNVFFLLPKGKGSNKNYYFVTMCTHPVCGKKFSNFCTENIVPAINDNKKICPCLVRTKLIYSYVIVGGAPALPLFTTMSADDRRMFSFYCPKARAVIKIISS